jgi:hypothetical protein
VILYELLTGHPPFRGGTALETVHLMLSLEPLPPSRLRSDLPRDLETICLHCLHRLPERRYASAAQLAEDLDRFLSHQPIRARPTPAWEWAWKWARRQPGMAGLVASLIVLFLLSFALVTSQWLRAEAEQASSVAERDRAVRNARAEARARAEAQRLSARLLKERGVGLCEAGDLGPGLLWLIKSLETIPAQDVQIDQSLRLLLGGWGRQLHSLEGQHCYGAEVQAVLFEDDRLLVACRNQVHVWHVGRREPVRRGAGLPGEVRGLFREPAGVVAAVHVPGALHLYRVCTSCATCSDEWHVQVGQRLGPPFRWRARLPPAR